MTEEKTDYFFGCFVSGPAVYSTESIKEKDNALKLGQEFRKYIWGEFGISEYLKIITKSLNKTNLGVILFQFKINPLKEEIQVLKDIENFRSKEKSIGINVIINNENFFSKSHSDRKVFLGLRILELFDKVKPVLKRNKIIIDIEKIDNDLKDVIKQYEEKI